MVFGRNGVSPPKFLSPVRLCQQGPVIMEEQAEKLTQKQVPAFFITHPSQTQR